jgi:hypothetical protein
MRVLLTVEMDTDKANAAIRDNRLGQVVQSTLEALKPEAVYFGAHNGKRTGFFVFDLADLSDIPTIAEPFFQELGAGIDVIPVMDFTEVQKGLQKFGAR